MDIKQAGFLQDRLSQEATNAPKMQKDAPGHCFPSSPRMGTHHQGPGPSGGSPISGLLCQWCVHTSFSSPRFPVQGFTGQLSKSLRIRSYLQSMKRFWGDSTLKVKSLQGCLSPSGFLPRTAVPALGTYRPPLPGSTEGDAGLTTAFPPPPSTSPPRRLKKVPQKGSGQSWGNFARWKRRKVG